MICLTGAEQHTGQLLSRLRRHAELPLQEVRLDLLRRLEPELWPRLADPRLLVTCRSMAEGGGFAGSEAKRAAVLRRAMEQHPGVLDLEGAADPGLRRELYQGRGATRLLLSWHRFAPCSADQLRRLLLEAPPEADLLKLAVTVDDVAQLAPLLALSRELDRPLVLVGMGPAGLLSRVLYQRMGSPWTYVAAPGSPPLAPGQLTLEQALAVRTDRAAELTPLGLLGGPSVLRSPGPAVYNALFAARELPYLYLPLPTARPTQALGLLEQLGFGGLSVTIPHKRAAARLLADEQLAGNGRELGAVNTLVRPHRTAPWQGHNTDVDALQAILAPRAGQRALVLGAGGAAAAAAQVLARLGCPTTICNRDPQRARALAQQLGLASCPWPERGEQPFGVLVNATPLGSDGESDPMPPASDWSGRLVLDAVIAPKPTPLLRRAAALGARVVPGTRWWVLQGARQLQLMTGAEVSPDELQALLPQQPAAASPQPTQAQPLEQLAAASPQATDAVRIRVPGSKSQTQRALLLAALAQGTSTLHHPLECDDSRALRQALRQLGVTIHERPHCWQVDGGTLHPPARPISCGEAGTTLRFLAPLALLLAGELVLTGHGRLGQRPHGQLVQALRQLHVTAHAPADPGQSLPLRLRRGAAPPATVQVDITRSSQHLSGLLMVAPRLPQGLELHTTTEGGAPAVSLPYVEMTLGAMKRFGVAVQPTPKGYRVAATAYSPCELEVEGDWSGAAFLLAASRLSGRRVQLEQLDPDSLQGDRAIVELLTELERPRAHHLNLAQCPDLIAPLAAAAVSARHPVHLEQVGHARIKESDRIAVLCRGLDQAGVQVEQRPDSLTVLPGAELHPCLLDPAGDHRMAMAFGLLSLLQPGVRVSDPGCVSKSYPRFWDHLERFR